MNNCIECNKQIIRGKVCTECRGTLTVKCKCGCNESILKYGAHYRGASYTRRFKKGHGRKLYHTDVQIKRAKYNHKRTNGHRNKAYLVKYYGGKCEECGIKYNGTNACIFQFHHINPDQKTWKDRGLNTTNHSIKTLLKMTDKCQLLCANCHKLKHSARY